MDGYCLHLKGRWGEENTDYANPHLSYVSKKKKEKEETITVKKKMLIS